MVETECYPEKRLAASEFLRKIVPARCLAYIRFPELMFPPYDPLPYDDHPAVLDWCITLHWIRDKVNAPALTIHFVTAHPFPPAVYRYRRASTKEEGVETVRVDGLTGFTPFAWQFSDNRGRWTTAWRSVVGRRRANPEGPLRTGCNSGVPLRAPTPSRG